MSNHLLLMPGGRTAVAYTIAYSRSPPIGDERIFARTTLARWRLVVVCLGLPPTMPRRNREGRAVRVAPVYSDDAGCRPRGGERGDRGRR
eukprot:4624591-Pleurochrysis_carterae.AAC.1